MDPFAQSREDDDLFADEFEPISEQAATIDPPEITQPVAPEPKQPSAESEPFAPKAPAAPVQQERRRDGQERSKRGRGRGGNSAPTGLSQSRYAAQTEPAQTPPAPTTTQQPPPKKPALPPTAPSTEAAPVVSPAAQTAPITEPSGRTPAVRGDRSATGGPAHKKLTEEELTAKMEKMAIINAQKAERHRLSEADQAAFQQREKVLAKERREKAVVERKNERAMEMERAKNRERKIKAQGGREWDSEKTEADIVDRKGRSSEYVRGGHGGVIRGGGLSGSRYAAAGEVEDESNEASGRRGNFEIRGRGRGGRGNGRGGGRGGRPHNVSVPTQEDFPPLSAAAVATPTAGGDWAEEMATPVEEKKVEMAAPVEEKKMEV